MPREFQGYPELGHIVSKALLVQPSSASFERVFSPLKASFEEQQDYLEASLMLPFNSCWKKNIARVANFLSIAILSN